MSDILHEDIQLSAILSEEQQLEVTIFELQQRLTLEEQVAEHRKEKDELLTSHRSQKAHAIKRLKKQEPIDIHLLLRTQKAYVESLNTRHAEEREALYFRLRQEYGQYIRCMITGTTPAV